MKRNKVILTGPPHGGKSAILAAVHERKLVTYESTIGVDLAILNIEMLNQENVESSRVSIHIWDTSGDIRYSEVIGSYFLGADAAWFVFDLSDPSSVNRVWFFVDLFKEKTPIENVTKKFLVGNKNDKTVTEFTESTVTKEIHRLMHSGFFLDFFRISSFDFAEVKQRLEETSLFYEIFKGTDSPQSSQEERGGCINNTRCISF